MKRFTSLMLLLLCAVTTTWAQLEVGKVYQFKSGRNASKAMYMTETEVRTATLSETDRTLFFAVEEGTVEGTFALRNIYYEKYIKPYKGESTTWTVSAEKTAETDLYISVENEETGAISIRYSEERGAEINNAAHHESWYGGIVSWASSAGASQWTPIYIGDDVDHITLDVPTVEDKIATSYLKAKSTVSWATDSWKQAESVPESINNDIQAGIAKENVYSIAEEIEIKTAATLTALFKYSSGGNRLDIVGVDLVKEDGTVLVGDYHFGYTGNAAENNLYELKVTEAGTYTIRFFISNKNEELTSNGVITLCLLKNKYNLNGYYRLKNQNLEKCLEVETYKSSTGIKVRDSRENDYDQWFSFTFNGTDPYYKFETYIGYDINPNPTDDWYASAEPDAINIIDLTLDENNIATFNCKYGYIGADSDGSVYANKGNDDSQNIKWVLEEVKAEEIPNKVNRAADLVSGAGYSFRNGNGSIWLSHTEDKTSLDRASEYNADNCIFAYYKNTVTNKEYLYNIGAKKFVVGPSGSKVGLSETPSEGLTFKATVIAGFPIMMSTDGGTTAVNHNTESGIIAWKGGFGYTDDAGNAFYVHKTLTVDEETLATIAEAVEAYELPLLKAELQTAIDNATPYFEKDYIAASLVDEFNVTKAAATELINNDEAALADFVAKISEIRTLVNRTQYVTNVSDFSNNAVYTIIAKSGAYVMYDEGTTADYAISSSKFGTLTTGADVAGCQWSVYKSESGKFYMYNIGAGKFVGTTTAVNGLIPLSEKPTSDALIFKPASVENYMVVSVNNGGGSLNHNNGNIFQYGLLNWQANSGGNGWDNLSGNGNIHQIVPVGILEETKLESIKSLVETYETVVAKQNELKSYLDEISTGYYDAYNAKWRIKPGLNNYSQQEGDEDFVTAYNEARTYETSEDVDAIQAQIDRIDGLVANLTINQPESGKYYRVRCAKNNRYLSSNTNQGGTIVMNGNSVAANDATSIFYYDGAFMSLATGLYISAASGTENVKPLGVGERHDYTIVDGKLNNNNSGSYLIAVNNRYLYGGKENADSGSSQPTSGDKGYNWWLEEVTSLPVTITAAEYATFNAPVEVTIPEDVNVKAHTVTINGEWATLNEIEGKVIPANTPVILNGAAGTYNLDITTTGAAAIEGNALSGTVAAEYATTDDTKDVFVLAKVDTTDDEVENPEVGLYLADRTSAFALKGHAAYLVLDKANPANNSVGFRFDFATTAVEKVEMRNEKEEIYDLQGRRINEITQPGIYVVNGVKRVVK